MKKVLFYSAHAYDEKYFLAAAKSRELQLTFVEAHLDDATAALAQGHDVVCLFVNDQADGRRLALLADAGVSLLALRCAGFNNVDVAAAARLGITVVRVPAYSPHAVAEHAIGLMLSLNRKIARAYGRVRDGNFSLDGLLGFDFHGRTIGVVGAGRIGAIVCRVMQAMGMQVLVFDPQRNQELLDLGVHYVDLDELLGRSDVISLHCPLNESSYHLIDAEALAKTRPGVMLINTSRGAVVDCRAVIAALKSGHLGYLGMDVYEQESELFFEDRSEEIIQDDVLERLLTFPNVLVTAHQGFFTDEAMTAIAETTLDSIERFFSGRSLAGVVVSADG